MALNYNLGYQVSISVHPTGRQIFAGKPYSTFPNIWHPLIYQLCIVVSFEQCLHPLFSCYFVGNEKRIKFYQEGKLLATRKMISTDTAGLIRNGQHPRSTEPDQIVLLSRRSKTWMIQHFQLSELPTRVCTKWFCQIALCHLLQLQRKFCPRD